MTRRIAFDLLLSLAISTALHSVAIAKQPTKTIAVRIYVDEEEPRTDAYYQEVLGSRLGKASAILSQYGSVRFAVTQFGTWDSEDSYHDFAKSLVEFEKEVKPYPAELAIGFSSQYRLKGGQSNLGGTRGPLRKHILIREGSPNTGETERLEVLVHELAHYLGAAHSGQSNSVMRPVLGDHQSRARAFQIRLDRENAEIVRLVSNEMVLFHIKSVHQLSIPSKTALREQYERLAKSFPKDEVARRYVMLMDKSIRASVAMRAKAKSGTKTNANATVSSRTTKRSVPNLSVPSLGNRTSKLSGSTAKSSE